MSCDVQLGRVAKKFSWEVIFTGEYSGGGCAEEFSGVKCLHSFFGGGIGESFHGGLPGVIVQVGILNSVSPSMRCGYLLGRPG